MENNTLITDSNKVFLKKEYGICYGNILVLGNVIDENGNIRKETADDYVEIDRHEDFEVGDLHYED